MGLDDGDTGVVAETSGLNTKDHIRVKLPPPLPREVVEEQGGRLRRCVPLGVPGVKTQQ